MNSIFENSLEANVDSSEVNYIVTMLVKIWCNLLNQEKEVGVDESFFYFGADSITVLKLVFRIQEYFQVHLLFREIFDNPTILQLAVLIEKKWHEVSE